MFKSIFISSCVAAVEKVAANYIMEVLKNKTWKYNPLVLVFGEENLKLVSFFCSEICRYWVKKGVLDSEKKN